LHTKGRVSDLVWWETFKLACAGASPEAKFIRQEAQDRRQLKEKFTMFINFIYFILAAIGIISAFFILTSLNPISR